MVERHRHGLPVDDTQPETVALRRPGYHVTFAHVERGLPFPVGLIRGHRIILAIVVDLEFHAGILHGPALFIDHRHHAATRRHIAPDDVDLGIAGRPLDDIFLPLVVAEHLGVQDQRP